MIRRLLAAVAAALTLMTFTAAPAYAIAPLDQACNPESSTAGSPSGSTVCEGAGGGGEDPIAGPNGVLPRIVTLLAIVAGIVSLITLIWGGVKYINSGGNASETASAKNTIIYALVGLLVAFLAAPIINFALGLAIK